MKTLKMFGMALTMFIIFTATGKAQTFVTIQVGAPVPVVCPPGVVYVNPYGVPLVGHPYGGGCNRVYVAPRCHANHYQGYRGAPSYSPYRGHGYNRFRHGGGHGHH